MLLNKDVFAEAFGLQQKTLATFHDLARGVAGPECRLVELPPDSYYTFDLVGCDIFEATSGKQIGKLVDVQRYPASDVYVIETVGGREVLVPAVRQYIVKVDIDRHRIEIEPGGLFDEE